MNFKLATIEDKKDASKLLFELLNVDSVEEAENTFEKEINAGHKYILALENNEAVGLISFFLHGRIKHGLVELYHLVVLEKMRGKGVAQQLMDELEIELKKIYQFQGGQLRKLFLMTRATNKRAQKFYKKAGFIHEAILKEHFYIEQDELVMSKFY